MLNTKMIGNKIAEARKKLNISQALLAQRLFISSQAVGKWERGESMPDIVTLNRLAEILGVDLNYFAENHQSAVIEMKPAEFSEKHPDELPSEKQKKKLNRDMSLGNWVDADFSGLKNLHGKFGFSNMQRCKFIGSDLSGLQLKNNHVDSCDFSGSDFSSSQIKNSNLAGNLFKNCSLKETEFTESSLSSCDFSGADFTGTTFKYSTLLKNIMAKAIWIRTSFVEMVFDDTIFDGVIEDCSFENCAFNKVTFQNATLINTFFKNKSLKRIKFIDCQADRMTYEFLKNGKAELSGISLLKPKEENE